MVAPVAPVVVPVVPVAAPVAPVVVPVAPVVALVDPLLSIAVLQDPRLSREQAIRRSATPPDLALVYKVPPAPPSQEALAPSLQEA